MIIFPSLYIVHQKSRRPIQVLLTNKQRNKETIKHETKNHELSHKQVKHIVLGSITESDWKKSTSLVCC